MCSHTHTHMNLTNLVVLPKSNINEKKRSKKKNSFKITSISFIKYFQFANRLENNCI